MQKRNILGKLFILFIIGLVVSQIVIGPSFIKPGNRYRFEIGEYKGYAYTYEKKSWMYRKPLSGGEEVVVSTSSPTSKDVLFFKDDFMIYSSYKDELIKINLDSFERRISMNTGVSPYVIGVADHAIVAQDMNNQAAIVVYDMENLDIIYKIEMQPSKYKIENNTFLFVNSKNSKVFELNLQNGEMYELESFVE